MQWIDSSALATLGLTWNGLAFVITDGSLAGDGTTWAGGRTWAGGHTWAGGRTWAGSFIASTYWVNDDGTVEKPAQLFTQAHISDMDTAVRTEGASWGATITIAVHDASNMPLAGVAVTGKWDSGAIGRCVTDADGQCEVTGTARELSRMAEVSFSITNVARADLIYAPDQNHDVDGDSDGTTIRLTVSAGADTTEPVKEIPHPTAEESAVRMWLPLIQS